MIPAPVQYTDYLNNYYKKLVIGGPQLSFDLILMIVITTDMHMALSFFRLLAQKFVPTVFYAC
jgi:hypothetical protein